MTVPRDPSIAKDATPFVGESNRRLSGRRRADAQDDSVLSVWTGAPRWVRPVVQLGAPMVVMFWLLYVLVYTRGAQITDLTAAVTAAHTATLDVKHDLETHMATYARFTETDRREHEQNVRLWRLICANTAKSDVARNACLVQ